MLAPGCVGWLCPRLTRCRCRHPTSALQHELDMYDAHLRASPAAIVATKIDSGDCADNIQKLRTASMLPVLEVRYVSLCVCVRLCVGLASLTPPVSLFSVPLLVRTWTY